ncbi:MAG TPA: hypothetical protein VNC78_07705 [Actinomycetota bacterium]|nr:hypothetical protein [Actinomycetota bacterium]
MASGVRPPGDVPWCSKCEAVIEIPPGITVMEGVRMHHWALHRERLVPTERARFPHERRR